MRDISSASLAKLATNYGTEPVNILAIQWTPDGPLSHYGDRTISGFIQGRILSISQIDNVVDVSGGGYSESVQITLDDHDGSIKAILDAHDVHKRPCYIYQWFEGLDLSERFIVFQGQVSSPITWREGDRSVSFTIVSKLEDREIGFSAEEGAFESIPERLVGQPWPMVFGTALDVPALALTEPRLGTITSGAAIRDFTLPLEIQMLTGLFVNMQVLQLMFFDLAAYALENGNEAAATEYQAELSQILIRQADLANQINQLEEELADQIEQETPTLTVLGGENFPQNQTLTIDINEGLFTGYFQGQTFHILSRQHPRFGEVEQPFAYVTFVIDNPGGLQPRELVQYTERIIGEKADFFFAPAGSRVKLASGEPQDYVASIVPGNVLNVSAYRAFEGVKRLVTVPPELYSVRVESFGSIGAVIVRLDQPLSNRAGEGWEDEIYVTFESSIGPNVADILEYLIAVWTPELSTDSLSFDHIRSVTASYPANFAILDRKNVIQVLKEISRQARCAIWLSGTTFKMRYLPEVPDAVTTITESDIMPKSMEVSHTETEDLVTKLTAEWRESYAAVEPNKVILKHNVKKYGTMESVEDYYIYNSQELVVKSATFWLIRQANTWKRVKFSTPISKLQLETLDGVELDFNTGYIANEDVIGIVEKADYDSDRHEIDFEVWTPVKAGTMVTYDFAYPAEVDQTLLFPTVEEIAAGNAGGDGPGKNANGQLLPPTFAIVPGYRIHQDYGDPRPSDTGDVAPPLPTNLILASLFDLNDPGLETSDYDQTPYAPGVVSTQIDIRRTQIVDSATGEAATLDSFFNQVKDGTIHLKPSITISDETNESPFNFVYDATIGQFAPEAAHLYDDEA